MKSVDVSLVVLKHLSVVYDCFVILSKFGKTVRPVVKSLQICVLRVVNFVRVVLNGRCKLFHFPVN